MSAQETVICANCGKEFTAWKCHKRKYCSKECFLETKRNRVDKICEVCGKEFTVVHSRKDTARYCSKSCRAKAQWERGNLTPTPPGKHPNYQGPKTVRCIVCGKEFEVSAGYYNDSRKNNRAGFHCSKHCLRIGQSQRQLGRTKAQRVPVTCSNCGKSFTVLRSRYERAQEKEQQNWYCSIECRYPGPATVICAWCGKEFDMTRSYYNDRQKQCYEAGPFCSTDCRAAWMSENFTGEDNPNWHGGSSFEPYGTGFDESLRHSIRRRDDYHCQLCGRTQRENLAKFGRKLSVHHIDYSKDDHSPDNLVTLCHTCHSETNGNREYFEVLLSEIVTSK